MKFRAWTKEFQELYDWELLKREFLLNDFDDDDFIWQQYTGVKNNDGQEICDGDIVKLWQRTINGGYFAHICKVYLKENGTWMIEGHPEDDISYRTRLELYSHRNEVDVIGNIFENPELLQKG